MKTVRISERTARLLKDSLYQTARHWSPDHKRAIEEMERALAPKRVKPERKASRAAKAGKKAAEASLTTHLRAYAHARAGRFCECGCGQHFTESLLGGRRELDHFFGRGKVEQNAENVWMLRADCHREKTLNRPDAAHWLKKFIAHAQFYGYGHEVARARKRLDALTLSAQSAEAGKAVGR